MSDWHFRRTCPATSVMCVLVTVLLSGCGDGSDRGDSGPPGSSSDASVAGSSETYLNWAPDAEYVGREACGQCHQEQYASFVRSQMGRSWKHAARSLSDADWTNVEPLYSESDDLYYQPFTRGDDMYVREYRIVEGDTTHNRVEQIDYIVGSGHHTNSHIYEENGYLYQIPVTWYAQAGEWGLAPKFQKANNNYRFGRVITDECMACHNGQPEFVAGSENRFEVVPSGIGCEKCHGPGSKHVERINAGGAVDVAAGIDNSIVNPGKLSPQRELDVCQRCHMQGASVFRGNQTPLDWRPGKPLSSHENVFWPRQPDSTERFIMASHPDRLRMSECFLATWEEESAFEKMTCLTCHDPHQPIEEQNEGYFGSICQSCHPGNSTAEPVDGQLPPTAEGGRAVSSLSCTEPSVVAGTAEATCIDCHMPLSTTTDIPNVRVTDHYIRIPDPADERVSVDKLDDMQRFVRLASLVVDDPTDRDVADGFLTYYEQFTDRPGMLDSASVNLSRAVREQEPAALTGSYIRLWHLQRNFSAIRSYVNSAEFEDPHDAWTYYRIGEAFAAATRSTDAVNWYEKAVGLGPDHLRFMDKLAVAYTQAGRIDEALATYDRILGRNPKFEVAWNNRGFARLVGGDVIGAEEDFRQALSLNPDMERAIANLASLLYNTDRQSEARPLVRKLIREYPTNPDYARMWNLLSG